MATHTSVLAWEIPWTEEPHELQSRGGKESDTTERLTVYRFWVASVQQLQEIMYTLGKSWLSDCAFGQEFKSPSMPFSSPGDLLNPGIKPLSPMSPALQVDF